MIGRPAIVLASSIWHGRCCTTMIAYRQCAGAKPFASRRGAVTRTRLNRRENAGERRYRATSTPHGGR